MNRKTIVISAINYFEGGPLTILRDCLSELSNVKYSSYEIIVLVHKISLFENEKYPVNILFRELPNSRKSYLFRLYYEFVYFNRLTKSDNSFKNVYLWFSLHDISPKLKAEKKAVYWQSPSPFYRADIGELFSNTKLFFHSFLYRYVLQFNHRSNDFIVVQAYWLKKKVSSWFNISKNKIVVAQPIQKASGIEVSLEEVNHIPTFFYPSLPRTHKNFTVLGQAAKVLLKQGITNFQIILTFKEGDNSFSKSLYKKFGGVSQIKFVGVLDKKRVFEHYAHCSALVFPSRLETWGLPISEFKDFQKPMLIADLPYAQETVGAYSKARFLDANDPEVWAAFMKKVILKEKIDYQKNRTVDIPSPNAENWEELFNVLLE
ncbi:glycosyltransferase [uncultured Arcticibacterium sp.]|uniref:glycosyltransferase n=1 Tax=uncultured Arcticibacterium sp. TaxID=2173042 RepID=UPI0030FB4267